MANMNIMAGLGVAVREFPLATGEADYGLYIDGKVAGVIEAKQRAETLVTSFRRPIVSGKAIAVGSSTSSLARRYRIQSAIERN